MVLKFCGGLWDASRLDGDLDAAASRQRRLQELLREGSTGRNEAKFKKEVRVVLDSKRPHGIAFAGDDAPESLGYACLVASIDAVPRGQVAEYNARCKAIGDYAHVITEGMRVRSVDNVDVKDAPYEAVLQRIAKSCAGVTGCAITFADVSSQPIARARPKLKTVGTVVLAAQRAQQKSPAKMALTSPSSPASPTTCRAVFNAHASPKVSKWSSVLTQVKQHVKANESQADVLATDLAHKNSHLEAQLLLLKGKLGALEREKAELEKERAQGTNESTEQLEKLQAERHELQVELQKANEACASASQRSASIEDENGSLRAEIATLSTAMVELQHQYDGVVLQMQELQVEHRDVHHDAEELHSRLVAAQLTKSELNDQLQEIKREQSQELAAVAAMQAEWTQRNEPTGASSPSQQRRRSSAVVAVSVPVKDSPTITLLKQVIQSRDALEAQNEELHIELSCHETTIQHQQEQLTELTDKLTAVTQMRDSLRDQVRALMASPAATPQEDAAVDTTPPTTTDAAVRELERLVNVERSANARLQSALQTLQDRARAKLEQHEKEQIFLVQFKELLAKGITVTKYGTRGSPHVRVLYADPQCHWISWRHAGDGDASSPRADAKVETMDLVEVLLGAATETFAHHKPEIPARCLSLVFCHPCRTLDVEVETRDRALWLRRGFRLLLEAAADKRRHHEDEHVVAVRQ